MVSFLQLAAEKKTPSLVQLEIFSAFLILYFVTALAAPWTTYIPFSVRTKGQLNSE